MRRLNIVIVEGEIEQITFSRTEKKQEDCASFLVVVDRSKDLWVKAHVNAFGEAARICKDKGLGKGTSVLIFGELMTRLQDTEKRSYTTEIRLIKIFSFTPGGLGVHSIRQTLDDALSLDRG